jgi:hypothetical protein
VFGVLAVVSGVAFGAHVVFVPWWLIPIGFILLRRLGGGHHHDHDRDHHHDHPHHPNSNPHRPGPGELR